MSRLLFENSKFAIGFAGVTLGGAALFAAFGGDHFAADPAASGKSEATEVAKASPKPRPSRAPANQPDIEDFVPDEDLIDNTAGFDPSPQQSKEVADLEFDDGGEDDEGFDDLGFGSSDPEPTGSRPRTTPRPAQAPSRASSGSSSRPRVTVRNQGNGDGPKVTVSENVKIR